MKDVDVLGKALKLYHEMSSENLCFFFSLMPLVIFLSVASQNLYQHGKALENEGQRGNDSGSSGASSSGSSAYKACSFISGLLTMLIIPL